MKNVSKLVVVTLIVMLVLSACQFPSRVVTQKEATEVSAPEAVETASLTEVLEAEVPEDEPTPEQTADLTVAAEQVTEDVQITDEPTEVASTQGNTSYGPTDFPVGVNPLTGLLAVDPSFLRYPPALVSVSNFPASARPQAGLSFSPLVFELAIGEGMTRFLAVFYGSFPSAVSGQTEGDVPGGGTTTGATGGTSGSSASGGMIGPIRSGRLPYESMRAQLNGFLVMASADASVAATLSGATSIFGSDSDDINSALIGVDQLEKIANAQFERLGREPYLEGLYFNQAAPEGGESADQAWVYYSNLNQIQWDYSADLGAFVRSDISTDGKANFTVSTDRLNGNPIAKENVIILFADHNYISPTKIDIELNNVPKAKAILFRDGQAYEIFWMSKYGDYEKETGLLRPIRFMDADGNPFPLKPGETWIEIVSLASQAWEADPSRYPFNLTVKQPGSGLWAVRYYGKY